MSLKNLRMLIKQEKYNDIVQLLIDNDMKIPTLDFLNSILTGLSKIEIWDFKIPISDFINTIILNSYIFEYNETTYTGIINLYSNTIFNDMEKSLKYLDNMIQNDLDVKKRTLQPLFDLGFRLKNKDLIQKIYLLSKINNIIISSYNFIQILIIFKDDILFTNIVKDFVKNFKTLNFVYIQLLQSYFKNNISTDEEINYSKFIISTKNKTVLLNHIDYFIKLSLKNKTFIKKVMENLNSIKKNKKELIVIDGANLGFFKQGTNSGVKINFNQILQTVNKLIELKKDNILLVLNTNHFSNISKKENAIVQILTKKINIIKTLRGVDDDLIWLYSSIFIDNSKILTNDNIANHLHYLNINDSVFKDFKKYKIINYDIQKTSINILIPPEFTQEMYKNKNKLIIPYFNNSTSSDLHWQTFELS